MIIAGELQAAFKHFPSLRNVSVKLLFPFLSSKVIAGMQSIFNHHQHVYVNKQISQKSSQGHKQNVGKT
jgi:hypothetical protein